MPIEVFSVEENMERLRAALTALNSDIVASEDSEIGLRMRMLVEVLMAHDAKLKQIEHDLFPSDKTSTEALEKHGEARIGPSPRKGASIASGTNALRVYGTDGTEVEEGLTLSATNGVQYQITSTGDIGDVVTGYLDVDIESIDTGTAANRNTGETLTFDSPPAGITATADVIADIDGAIDAETDAQLLARILDLYANPPGGGRFSDYRQWANAVDGVSSAYAYGPHSSDTDGRRGLGYVDVAIVGHGTGSARIPAAAIQTAVEEAIEDKRPATVRDVNVLIPVASSQNIDIKLTPKTGYEFDWSDGGSPFTVSGAHSSGAKTITLNAAHTSTDIADGDRILINGVLYIIDDLPTSTTVLLTTGLVTALSGGETVYPGGPLTEAAQEAIKDYMDTLGPAKGTAGDPEHNDWDDVLRVNKLIDACFIDGVKDITVVTPSANVTPTDNGTDVQLIHYNRIIVRSV